MNWYKQLLKFTGVGAVGTTAHYLVLFVLVELLSASIIASAVCGYVAGAMINYVLNYYWTFKSESKHLNTAFRFGLIAVIGLLLNTLLMIGFSEYLGVWYFYSQILSTAFVFIFNFIFNKFLTFK